MSLLSTLTTSDDIANEKDSVGNGGPLPTGIYLLTVNTAYVMKSKGGALGLVLNLKTEEGREVRQTLWMTSGDAKGNKNYYEDKNKQKQYLPGFNAANALALLTVGKEIGQLDTEKKIVKVYDPATKTDVPTPVDMVMDLLGQEIYAGIFKQIVDKNVQADNGSYVPSGETREENEIDKFFRAKDKMTTAEIRAQAEEPAFFNTWQEKWDGETRDKSTKAAPGAAGAPAGAAKGGVGVAGGTKKPTTSLFGGGGN